MLARQEIQDLQAELAQIVRGLKGKAPRRGVAFHMKRRQHRITMLESKILYYDTQVQRLSDMDRWTKLR